MGQVYDYSLKIIPVQPLLFRKFNTYIFSCENYMHMQFNILCHLYAIYDLIANHFFSLKYFSCVDLMILHHTLMFLWKFFDNEFLAIIYKCIKCFAFQDQFYAFSFIFFCFSLLTVNENQECTPHIKDQNWCQTNVIWFFKNKHQIQSNVIKIDMRECLIYAWMPKHAQIKWYLSDKNIQCYL